MELTQHEFVFGSKLTQTVEWILEEAIRLNTPLAFDNAAQQLQGLDRLMLSMGLHIAALRISNTQRKLRALKAMLFEDDLDAISEFHGLNGLNGLNGLEAS